MSAAGGSFFSRRWCAVAVFFVACGGAAAVRGDVPGTVLVRLVPGGGSPGSQVEVSLAQGEWLDDVRQLIFSHPGITAEPILETPRPYGEASSWPTGRFHVQIPPNVAPGMVEVRAVGRYGVSNSRRWWVGPKPWRTDVVGAPDFASAPLLPLDALVEDRCEPRAPKHYRMELKAGQAWSITTHTRDLDSQARLVVSLFRGAGVRLQQRWAEDGGEVRMQGVADRDEALTVVVHDHLYQGGHERAYVLETSSSPLAPSAPCWSAAQVASLTRPSRFTIHTAEFDSEPQHHLENSNAPDEAALLTFPARIEGRFDTNEDIDLFEFDAVDKSPMAVEVTSQRLEQITDPLLVIYRRDPGSGESPRWIQVAAFDDTNGFEGSEIDIAHRDPAGVFTPPEPGRYRLVLRNQQRSSRADAPRGYVLSLRAPQPGWALITAASARLRDPKEARPSAPSIRLGVPVSLAAVLYRRDGFRGSVHVVATSDPPLLPAAEGWIGPDQATASLTLAASDAQPQRVTLRVRGSSEVQGQAIEVDSLYAETTVGPTDTRRATTARVVSSLIVSGPEAPPPLKVTVIGDNPLAAVAGKTFKVKVQLERSDRAKHPAVIRWRSPLEGRITGKEIALAPDQAEGEIEFEVKDNVSDGQYSGWFQIETKVQVAPFPERLTHEQQYLQQLEQSLATTDAAQAAPLTAAIEATKASLQKLNETYKPRDFDVQWPGPALVLKVHHEAKP